MQSFTRCAQAVALEMACNLTADASFSSRSLPAVELLAAGPSVELVLPPPTSPEVLSTLSRFLAQALPPVLSSLQASAPRNEVERALEELLRTLRLVGPLPAFKVRRHR